MRWAWLGEAERPENQIGKDAKKEQREKGGGERRTYRGVATSEGQVDSSFSNLIIIIMTKKRFFTSHHISLDLHRLAKQMIKYA
jgi:hypothetical protein